MTARIDKLDSIRGIAAMAVVLWHCRGVLPELEPGSWLSYAARSPLFLLVDGRNSVTVFFVLSGLVLAPPFLSGQPPGYWRFVLRRICRIWIPLAAVVAAAILLYVSLDLTAARASSNPTSALNWRPVPTPAVIAHNLFMTGLNEELDPPLWSLVHEMRISLIFPLIMLLVGRMSWLRACLLAAAFSALVPRLASLHLGALVASLADTGRWVCFFVLGAVMAKYSVELKAWFARLALWQKIGLAGLGLVLMHAAAGEALAMLDVPRGPLRWVRALGAVLVFVVAVNSDRVGRLLEWPPLVFLGRISYSVYLVHAPLLILATSTAVSPLPFPVAVALVPVATVAVAALSYRLVELPAIGLGRRLSRRRVPAGGAAVVESGL
jgi:peptidoglycan/LPS O-acetylase OafA/YrhL